MAWCLRARSDLPAVVGPVQHGLTLSPATFEIALLAIPLDRRHMAPDGAPALDLSRVVGRTAAHVVAAVPLKPPSRILRTDPTLAAPLSETYRSVHSKEI